MAFLHHFRATVLTRAAVVVLAVLCSLGVVVSQERGQAGPSVFEVASVKPTPPGQTGTEVGRRPGGRLVAINATAVRLLRYAYAVQDYQLIALPAWAATDRFNVEAKMAAEPPRLPGADDPLLVATRALLAERFKLVTRRETRELDVYALVRARQDGNPGPALRPSAQDCRPDTLTAARQNGNPAIATTNGVPLCGIREAGGGGLRAGGTPMSLFALFLSTRLGRAVVDRTGLNGDWDIDVVYANLQGGALAADANAPAVETKAPSLFTALEEQLGLKLQATRAPVDVVVVDRIDHPSAD